MLISAARCSLVFALLAVPTLIVACSPSDDPAPSNTAGTSGTGGTAGTGGNAGTGGSAAQDIDPTPDELAAHTMCSTPSGAGTTHSGTITADETWTAAAGPHHIPNDLSVYATVTIEPCAIVLLSPGVTLQIGSSTDVGKLVGHGTSQLVNNTREVRPVVFDAEDTTNGWARIGVYAKGSIDLSIAALLNGGNVSTGERGALLVSGVAGGTNDGDVTESALVDRVLIEKSASYGVNLEGWGAFAPGSDKLWIRSSGSADYPYPVLLEPGVASSLPTALTVSGNVKDEILLHTSKAFSRSDTLVNRGIPYHQRGAMYVNGASDGADVKLTIEAGVTIAFENEVGSGMYIGSSETRRGVLEAVGTEAAPIVFTSAKDTKAPGDWMSLYFKAYPASGNHIAYAQIEYAGADSTTSGFGCGPGDNDGAVFIHGVGAEEKAPDSVFIDHTSFDNIGGTTVIVSGWVDDAGPDFTPTNTFGASTPSCHVSRPRRSGAGDVCDGGRTTCW